MVYEGSRAGVEAGQVVHAEHQRAVSGEHVAHRLDHSERVGTGPVRARQQVRDGAERDAGGASGDPGHAVPPGSGSGQAGPHQGGLADPRRPRDDHAVAYIDGRT